MTWLGLSHSDGGLLGFRANTAGLRRRLTLGGVGGGCGSSTNAFTTLPHGSSCTLPNTDKVGDLMTLLSWASAGDLKSWLSAATDLVLESTFSGGASSIFDGDMVSVLALSSGLPSIKVDICTEGSNCPLPSITALDVNWGASLKKCYQAMYREAFKTNPQQSMWQDIYQFILFHRFWYFIFNAFAQSATACQTSTSLSVHKSCSWLVFQCYSLCASSEPVKTHCLQYLS